MDDYESLSHSKWDCKYHVVFIPKCRRKMLYGELRQHLGEVFRRLAMQKESRVEEGHLMPDHVHMMISIPPKYSVSQVIGYFVSTVGRDEAVIREYIRKREAEDARLDQLNMWR
jgi:putative transposase